MSKLSKWVSRVIERIDTYADKKLCRNARQLKKHTDNMMVVSDRRHYGCRNKLDRHLEEFGN